MGCCLAQQEIVRLCNEGSEYYISSMTKHVKPLITMKKSWQMSPNLIVEMPTKKASVSNNVIMGEKLKGMSCTMLSRKCENVLVYMWGVISGR